MILPPSAFKVPFTVVFEFELWISDQTTISPPSPISNADASSIVPSAIVVFVAWKTSLLLFCQLPPISINPPDFFPTVEIFEFSSIWIFSAVTLIEPPWFCWELAAITPEFNTLPLLAERYIFPPFFVIPSALKDPEFFITAFLTSLTPLADKIIVPSSTLSACLLSINAFNTPLSIEYWIKLFPFKLSLTFSPDIRATVPSVVSISPLFSTCGAIIAIVPPSRAFMSPWLLITPENPFFSKTYLSSIKSLSFKFKVDAMIDPTSTLAPSLNKTPFGLIRIILPLDFRLP